MDLILTVTIISAVASIIGAIFAVWRWEYARKAYIYQKRQLYLQVRMLAESREYWKMPKMKYVGNHCNDCKDSEEIMLNIIKEIEKAFK